MDEIINKPDEWISVAYREGVWIGKREDGSYISSKGENAKWVWESATEEEIVSFNSMLQGCDQL